MAQFLPRRDFVKQTTGLALAGVALGATSSFAATQPSGSATGVRRREEPVAIAMWDFSWLLRHYPGGEFEDWDAVLDGLVQRGYNAVRIDAFPLLVAPDAEGRVVESFAFPKADWKPAMWGNQYSTTIQPRKALKEFIPRCLDRGLLLALSTWFDGPGAGQVAGVDGLVRLWDATLTFLKENDLLHQIYYVDLLNEYPLFNGFSWIRDQMDQGIGQRKEKAQAGGVHEWKEKAGDYNSPASRAFYTQFANEAITRLSAKWPELDFLFSLTDNSGADWRVMLPTQIAAADRHAWFVLNPLLPKDTGYWTNIHTLANNDAAFPKVQETLLKNWATHKPELIAWMDQEMAETARLARQYAKPVGNTEGWGIVNWLDHPALTWEIIQEAGEICARLGRKHGYRFNCTSNFTHPQFRRLWADVAWHRRVTTIIRGG